MEISQTIALSVCDPDDLIPWSLDINLFKEKYPSIYELKKDDLLKMEDWEIEELLPDYERVDQLTKSIKSVKLDFHDKNSHYINNIELIQFNGKSCDGYYIYSDKDYVYFIISKAAYQAGSLGIWSIKDKDWIFTHSEDAFCAQAVIYSESLKTFVGYSLWDHPMTSHHGEYFFVIRDGSYEEVNLKETDDFNSVKLSKDISRKFSDWDDHHLCFDEKNSAIQLVKGNKRLVYKLK